MTITASVENVTYNSPGGAVMGKSSTELIAFYGATPLVQASVDQQTTKTTTQLRVEVTALQDALVNLGLIALS